MGEDEFDDLLDAYLSGRILPNPEMEDVEIEWVRNNPLFGVEHIEAHGVTVAEVEEVLMEVPPEVEAKRHKDHPNRTIFWGATRAGRWLFVSCEDRVEGGKRILKPITAFEPEEGEEYWRQQ